MSNELIGRRRGEGDIMHRDIFLRIEAVADYSPLAPECCSRRWGNDCMRNPGHEIGRVAATEIFATTFVAMVYRQYADAGYTMPVTDKIVEADVNEPPWPIRVPGAVLWADVGDTLAIHVLNGDPDSCHSFHLHGLNYGIDSDGAWPLGVQGRNLVRSDDIHPGESWTYRFAVTSDTIGVWAFHDHHMDVQRWVNRGLFGALIVRDPHAVKADHEIPMFVHQLAGDAAVDGWESPALGHSASWSRVFPTTAESHPYHCKIHGVTMAGTVVVDPMGPATVSVVIADNTFTPGTVVVGPAGTVTWFNNGNHIHIVFAGGGGASSFCLNGRSYVGNTPTIEARPGERLRWYLLNTDVNDTWHNFHTHAMRWQLPTPPGRAVDVHPLSPLEGFTIDTIVPEPLALPPKLQALQRRHPKNACKVPIRGDFLFHCHIETHMMSGLAGLVRSRREIWVTDQVLDGLDIELPYDDGDCCTDVDGTPCMPDKGRPEMPGMGGMHGMHDAPVAPGPGAVAPVYDFGPLPQPMGDMTAVVGPDARPLFIGPILGPVVTAGNAGVVTPGAMGAMDQMGAGAMSVDEVLAQCAAIGAWEMLPCDSVTLAVHFALLHTGKVLIFSGSGNFVPRHTSHTYGSILWDYEEGTFTPVPITYDVFCAGQTNLPDGSVLACGGTRNYDSPWEGAPEAAVFDPVAETWNHVPDMADGRWYPTLTTLGNGTAIAFSGTNQAGTGLNAVPEVFDPVTATWSATPALRTPGWPLYPHVLLLSDGRLFFSGEQLGNAPLGGQLLDLGTGTSTPVPGLRLPDNRDQGGTIMLPPAQDQKVMVVGGLGPAGASAFADIADLGAAAPAYSPTGSMLHGRTRLNAVILPDRTVFVSGGGTAAEAQPVLQSEIYDPQTGVWSAAATATVPRLYHSVACLLPDGRVATAGSNPDRGDDELRIEIFHPPYLFHGARPFIEDAPDFAAYGCTFTLKTPNARDLKWVQLIRPMATTHSSDSCQRLIDLAFTRTDPCCVSVTIPDNPDLTPPGWYMLTVVDTLRRPSDARWIRIDHT